MPITSILPNRVVEGGRIALAGSDLPTEVVPSVVVGDEPARTLFASSTRIVIDLPDDVEGGRTPAEAGMKLQRHPRRPDSAPAIRMTIKFGINKAPDAWRDYLYWNVELDDES